VTVAPVGAENDILMVQMGTNTGRNGLFAHISVAGSMNQTSLMGAGQFLFGLANDLHGTKKAAKQVVRHVQG
jgi:hypothetical protein